MGRSRTFKYVLNISLVSGTRCTPMEWKRTDGKPTTQNIGKWVDAFEESCRTGANKHLGIDPVVSAQITENPGPTIAEWTRKIHKPEPMFQIINVGQQMADIEAGKVIQR